MPDSVSDMRTTIQIVFTMVREAFLSCAALHLENLALRQQLAVVHRKSPRPSLCTADRLFGCFSSKMTSPGMNVMGLIDGVFSKISLFIAILSGVNRELQATRNLPCDAY